MAQNQTLQHKRSTVPGNRPAPSAIAVGELAINFADKALYTKNTANQVVELASDIVKSASAPTSPAIGDLWYDTTNLELKFWNGSQWLNVAQSGKPVLPGNTTAPPAFTGAGTLASPFTITITAAPGATLDLGVFTITGLAPKQLVPITDINSIANGNRFVVTNNTANDSGVLSFRLIFEDYPVSTAGASYIANIQVGTATVYVRVNLSIANPIPPFPQTVNSPSNTVPVTTQWTSSADVLTSTGQLQISGDGVTYGNGPLAISSGATLYTRWAGAAGSGIGIDGANGSTITGTIITSAGSVSPVYSLTIDKTPAAFTFPTVTGVGLNTLVDSAIVTISGVNSYVYLTSSDITDASVNGASFVSVPSTGTSLVILSGQTLRIRETSSGTINTTTTVTISANGVTSSFSITTGNNIVNTPAVTTPVSGATGVAVNAQIVASAYTVTGTVGAHLNSDWEIYSDAALTTLVTSSMASTTNLTTWTPSGLAHLSQYWVRVRYRSNDSIAIVSEWSPTVTWTTIARVVNTPSITTPTNNATGVSTTAQIVASAYSVTGPAGTHLNSDWEIYGDAALTSLVTSSMASTTNLTTWTPSGLVNGVQYWVRVRYRSNISVVSDWSATVTWTTINRLVNTPTITAPVNGSTGILLTAQIVASAYSVTGPVGTHLNSDWQIFSDASLTTLVTSSLASTTNLTTWTPTGLSNGTQYWVQVRYRSNDGVVSSYSPAVSWTTVAASINTPTITTPSANNTTGNSTTLQLVSSAYSVSGPAGTHLNSDWEVYTNSSLTTLFTSSMASTTNLTTWTPLVLSNSSYWARVRYRSSSGIVSDWSPTRNWTTTPWTYQTGLSSTSWGTTDDAFAITASNTRLCVGGENGKIATSTNGGTWTFQSGLSSTTWGTNSVYSIAWSGTQFCAVSLSGDHCATSPDGVTWTYQPGLAAAGGSLTRPRIIWAGSRFCIGAVGGKILTSSDGVNWTLQGSTILGGNDVAGLAWNGSVICAISAAGGQVATSPDGVTWTSRTGSWGTTTMSDIASNGSGFVAVGNFTTVANSSDGGITWNDVNISSESNNIEVVHWSGSRYFAVTANGTSGILAWQSTNGTSWSQLPGLNNTAWSTTRPRGLSSFGTRLCVVGANAAVATAPI